MCKDNSVPDEELLEQCRITQMFFDRQLASGHPPETAFANAVRRLQRVCVFRWDSICLNNDGTKIIPRSP